MGKENPLTNISWRIQGQFVEACNCAFTCLCPATNRTIRPTQGDCIVTHVYAIERGSYGDITLDHLRFAWIARTPGPMADGNWSRGVVVDARAQPDQHEALAAIASGEAGGPIARLTPLVSHFLGVETRPIHFERDGMRTVITIPELLDEAVEGVPGVNPAEPIYFDNIGHSVNSRIALAKASRFHVNAFGLQFDSEGGTSSFFAPFDWQV
jgi:hypothetical protein